MRTIYGNLHTHEITDDLSTAKGWFEDGFRVLVVRLDENGKPFHRWEMT